MHMNYSDIAPMIATSLCPIFDLDNVNAPNVLLAQDALVAPAVGATVAECAVVGVTPPADVALGRRLLRLGEGGALVVGAALAHRRADVAEQHTENGDGRRNDRDG